MLATYLDLGYLNARLRAAVTAEPGHPHLFNVVYTVVEGPQGHVSNVILLGKRQQSRIYCEDYRSDLSDGRPLSQGKFFTAEGDLYNLGIFDWASIKTSEPITTQNEEEVLIKVHESKRYSLEVGGGIEVIPRSGNIPVGTVALPGLPPVGLGSHIHGKPEELFRSALLLFDREA